MEETCPKPLVVSVSGGRSSGIMARAIQQGACSEYSPHFYLFANTGKEREETLRFVRRMQDEWGLPIIWLEAFVIAGKGNATLYRTVDFTTAARDGEPFADVIEKYGLPNKSFLHCTRELKQQPVAAFMRQEGYRTWTTAMGMRWEEPGRMSGETPYGPAIYPLADLRLTRQEVRQWWLQQPFDLEIEDYQGNCDLCFKKSLAKRLRIMREEPQRAQWWKEQEVGRDYKFDLREGLSVERQIEMAAGSAIPANVDTQMEFPCFCS
jgi:3'-phosphoadenosine 5'-phosphosulfate sulfotransferase (PAPS reductase)/FAD synthetase